MQRFSVIRAAMITGSATLLSRLLGFLRDVMLAAALGAGPLADIFVVAFRLPNLFRRLFAEGAFSAAFVPLFAQKLENDAAKGDTQSARQMGAEVFAALFFALLIFTALAELAMPYFVYGLASGFAEDADKFARTVTFSRISFLYLICMSLMALFAAMLNAIGRFAAAGFAPVLLNIILIGALLLAALFDLAPLPVLIWGVAVAGFAQLVMVWLAAHNAGLYVPLSLIFRRPRLTDNVRRVLVLGVPGVLAAGVGQINILIGTNIASAQESAAAWLYYADRLYQLPLGVIGVALSVALLPDLARRLRAGDKEGAHNSLNRGLEAGLLLTLPAAFG
ncbi:MAG: murein biosynthesis integral membrane protein MurJ, partial [Alphaproteobacteria bacterium]|nr:murein biosynthesis integral membrane protein MurJ [Alphaproteobacteria bacterium]